MASNIAAASHGIETTARSREAASPDRAKQLHAPTRSNEASRSPMLPTPCAVASWSGGGEARLRARPGVDAGARLRIEQHGLRHVEHQADIRRPAGVRRRMHATDEPLAVQLRDTIVSGPVGSITSTRIVMRCRLPADSPCALRSSVMRSGRRPSITSSPGRCAQRRRRNGSFSTVRPAVSPARARGRFRSTSLPLTKFIGGAPMKPATYRLAGES